MDLRALIIIGPLFLFICYLLELAYYRGIKKGRKQGYDYGRVDGILEVKSLLKEDSSAKDKQKTC